MEFEQALEVVSLALNREIARPLTEVEVALLFGAWNKLTYNHVAARSGYSINYLQRDIGPKFWKLLSEILGRQINKTNLRSILSQIPPPVPDLQVPIHTATDWGEAPDVSTLQGRVAEIEKLSHWIIEDRCRLIALVGMGGMGKSALATKVAQLSQEQFQFVFWRSLRHRPPLETLLFDLVFFLSHQQDVEAKPERLLYWLQTHRCLVILDNQDTLLQAGDCAGYYPSDFANYSDLFRLLGESPHQSCLLLTSREKSAEVARLEDLNGWVRSLSVKGSQEASWAFIDSWHLVGTQTEKHQLCEFYRYNPLVLKMVAASIQNLFDGQIASFLQTETLVFNGIRRLLDQQFERLSPVEQTIMYWLAIHREWTTITELQADIVPAISRACLLESLESLTWRSLIEQRSGEYTQQPFVMEYVIGRLVQQLVTELLRVQLSSLNRYALFKTMILDNIPDSQIRLIVQPLIKQLKNLLPTSQMLEQHFQSLLSALHHHPSTTGSYGVYNFINLCRCLQIDLTQFDFSGFNLQPVHLESLAE